MILSGWKLSRQLFAAFTLLNLLLALMIVLVSYMIERRNLIENVDERLRLGIAAAEFAYADWIASGAPAPDGQNGPSSQSHMLQQLNTAARELRLSSIYAVREHEGTVVFWVSTTLNIEDGTEDSIWGRVYQQPSKKLMHTLGTGESTIDVYTDEYGTFRSLFQAVTLPDGSRMVWGSDVRKSLLMREFFKTLGINVMVLLLATAFSFWAVWWLSRRIARPLDALSRYTGRLVADEFNASESFRRGFDRLRQHSCREVVHLADSVCRMQQELQRYIEKVREEARARQRLESELEVARQIQQSLLPETDSVTGDPRATFEALMEPALEVGGDLFDFARDPQGRWHFCIGDVSGKGIPAALLMAVVQTLWKRAVTDGHDPAQTLKAINQTICEGRHGGMFVTMWTACLNPHDGRLTWANAGHGTPWVASTNGTLQTLQGDSGMALGIMSEAVYREHEYSMQNGQWLILSTDGLGETQNPEGGFYQETRLSGDMVALCKEGAAGYAARLAAAVKHFRADADVRDDLTLVVVTWNGAVTPG